MLDPHSISLFSIQMQIEALGLFAKRSLKQTLGGRFNRSQIHRFLHRWTLCIGVAIQSTILFSNCSRGSGLAPSQEAAPHILLRRSTLDLTGLPPSLQEVSALNANSTDLVFERWVDSLLERPGYGERWARHWLDLSRFAESHGYEQDYDRPHAFHYRDFVIRAFNDDLPFNTFVQWQLAGDELAPENVEAMKATGFLAAGAFPTQLTEKEFESARYNELDDMLSTVGTSMLGITIGCARCHDHKFDPIPQADYYTMLSTFTSTIRSNVDMQVNSKSHAEAMVAWQTKVDAAQSRLTAYESNELPIRAKAFFPPRPLSPTAFQSLSGRFPKLFLQRVTLKPHSLHFPMARFWLGARLLTRIPTQLSSIRR